eukprot:3135145-Pleurochrysis_carterae.AAC.1
MTAGTSTCGVRYACECARVSACVRACQCVCARVCSAAAAFATECVYHHTRAHMLTADVQGETADSASAPWCSASHRAD